MIDFDHLCQSINDWREGKRPDAPIPAAGGGLAAGVASAVEEVDSDLVMVDEQAYAEPSYEEQAYEEQSHGEPSYAEPSYEQQAYEQPVEGAPDTVAHGDRTQAYVPDDYDPAGVGEQEVAVESSEAESSFEEEEDYERDYDLEAQDDVANFDVVSDLSGWFVARMRIEQAWEDPSTRNALFAEFGIRDRQHFHQVQATMERYVQSEDAAARYGGLDDIMQLQMNAQQDFMTQRMQDRAQGELAGEFEPVEEIGLDEWAQCQAHIAGGGDVDEVVEALGIDQPTWDRVSAEWNARMSRDTTATIATAYGKAFAGAGAGQYAEAGQDAAQAMSVGGDVEGDPPISLERYVEIEQAQSAAADQGRDPSEVLAEFGMSPMDWGTVGGWWGQYIARHGMENNQELLTRYSALQEQYAAQYGGGQDADGDVDY